MKLERPRVYNFYVFVLSTEEDKKKKKTKQKKSVSWAVRLVQRDHMAWAPLLNRMGIVN